LAALKTGIVSYHQEGAEHRVAVGTGFVEVSEDRAVVLTDRFVKKADVDPVRARLELKEADEALDKWEGDPTMPEYAELVARKTGRSTARAVRRSPPPTVRTFQDIQLLRDTFVEEAAPLEEAYFEERDQKFEQKQRKKSDER
jgi:F-type H+-transporting ATPase subunit epsilon